MNKNMTVSTLKKFERKIKTTYEEGKHEDYFKQDLINILVIIEFYFYH